MQRKIAMQKQRRELRKGGKTLFNKNGRENAFRMVKHYWVLLSGKDKERREEEEEGQYKVTVTLSYFYAENVAFLKNAAKPVLQTANEKFRQLQQILPPIQSISHLRPPPSGNTDTNITFFIVLFCTSHFFLLLGFALFKWSKWMGRYMLKRSTQRCLKKE